MVFGVLVLYRKAGVDTPVHVRCCADTRKGSPKLFRYFKRDRHGSVVGDLDQTALLQALDEQMCQHPAWLEAEVFNQAMGIAHDEDVSTWVGKINQCLHECQITSIPLVQLQQTVEMPLG
jgi:hypothetical protein